MQAPSHSDYVQTYFTLFELFEQEQNQKSHRGHPFNYPTKRLILFFTIMMIRRISAFKAQHRWLQQHPQGRQLLGFETIPDRSTLSRRYPTLYETCQAFIAFLGRWAEALAPEFDSQVLAEDASLFKAQGPVWHQVDRQANRIPEKLRHLDTDASWGKSAYHGWVYGYSCHLTCNRSGFPKLVQVETASVDESRVIDQKWEALFALHPNAVVGDNAYFKATRVRQWAAHGMILVSPAAKWQNGKYAQAYHRFLKQKDVHDWLKGRKTAIEPVFDLFSKVLGTANNHKQLPVQGLSKVRPFLCLGVLAVQIAMIVNNVFGLPFRQISLLLSVLS
ncbi:MAG: transposase [Chloroflexi bacterium]|nr:transposase [Chloroflexota bacterium]